jgi:hypothetical protein
MSVIKSKFSLAAYKDPTTVALVNQTNQRILALWAIECAERVLPFFETKYPHDLRPRQAIEALQTWLKTGVFKMAVIRLASLGAHAAAKEIGNDSPAASAAHAAGQAVATAHVPLHALGAANYALQAWHRQVSAEAMIDKVAEERRRQLQRLEELSKS